MLIYTKIEELEVFLMPFRANKKQIGFVPTMGALHQGHLSLIISSKAECEITLCSIFVNPNQFNDKADLIKYPRTPKEDIALLESIGCDVLFMPNVEEVYPQKLDTHYNFGYLDTVLEGAQRPGHFNGVAQVVKRLFEIVAPTKAYFGSKDFQQVLIVKSLIKQLHLKIDIVACPILREEDGLAMSSRNTLLSSEERAIAANIPKWMNAAKELVKTTGIDVAKDFIKKEVSQFQNCKLDYIEVCESENLKILNNQSNFKQRVILIALFVGKIRLIDNINVD